jgi:hypothetical protein
LEVDRRRRSELGTDQPTSSRGAAVNKTETIALMAASIYSSISTQQRTQAGKEEITHGRIAAQAWALY